MGAKHSKREARHGSSPPSGSPSSKISRTRSLPSKIFSRRFSHEYGRFFRGKPLLEDVDGIDEYKQLVEFEKKVPRTGSSTKPDFTQSCISSLRGSREEIIYEGEEDDGGSGDQQQTSLKASPASSCRSSSQSASCLAEILGEVEHFEAVDGGDSEKPAIDQEDRLGSPDSTHSDLVSAAEFVDNSLQVESLSVDSVVPNGEGEALQEGNSLIADRDRSIIGCSSGAPVLREAYYFTFQTQRKRKTWKRLKRITCDQGNSERKMTGKGKVSLSFNKSGKQPRRHSFTDSRDFVWDSRDLFGKRAKDEEEEEDAADFRPGVFSWGLVGQTNPFLNYEAGFVETVPDQLSEAHKRWSPKKTSRGTALARRVRGLGGSPKPVTSMESCLRAQMADALISNRVKADPLIHHRMNSQVADALISNRVKADPLIHHRMNSQVADALISNRVKADPLIHHRMNSQVADALISNRVKADPLIHHRMNSQVADALISNRVSRPLYFSSTVAEEEDEMDYNTPPSSPSVRNAVDESSSKPTQTGLPILSNLSTFLKEYAAKLSITGKSERGSSNSGTPVRRRARGNNQASNDSNCATKPSFETLLFSFGVGLGILFVSGTHKLEAKRLSELLDQTQADLETLKLELARRKSPSGTNRLDSATRTVSKGQYSVRSYYGSEQQEDQMAELEAELEAELDQLTGGESATMNSQYSAMDELDVDASVVYGDLEPSGLPAGVEEDSDEDQSPSGQPACLNNYAVSPRELTRLLRKLQTSRQDKLIAELEEDLEAALSKLQTREKELELWKERVKCLTKVSFVSASGDEYLTPRVPTEGREEAREVSAALRSDSQEFPQLPMQEHGAPATSTVLEEDPGSHPSSGPVTQGDSNSSLHTVSAKQEPEDMGTDGSSEVTARDCKPILDNAQIITQLIDSVHGLESYGDHAESVEMGSTTPSHGLFSSSVSISDTLEETPERVRGKGTLLPQAKLLVPHPSRRTSYSSDRGNPVLISKLSENENPPPDHCTADVRYTESSKSLSDMSEATEIPYSVKYIDSTIRPASSEPGVPADDNPSFWVGRAGLTTPVETVRQQLFKAPQSAPVKWPGERSPTVLEKIAQWEGLMEGETPGPATGSDWECQSRASESEQQAGSDLDDINVFSEENLVLEAEEMLGRMLIKRIVEKSRLGSGSLVKKAQSALATLERDDGVDVYHGDDARTDSEADFSERSDDHEKPQLDDAVRKEYEFFRRLEIINKDRKALKSAKEKTTKETPDAGDVDFATIPVELNAAQPSPAAQPLGTTEVMKKDVEVQPDNVGKENIVKQLVDPNIEGRENWLARADATFRARSGYREDEVRSRRRS